MRAVPALRGSLSPERAAMAKTSSPRTEVAHRLRRLRESRGLSQMSLSLAADVSARHLSFLETGRSQPGRDVLLRLGAALELTDDELSGLLAAGGYGTPLPPASAATPAQLAPLERRIRAVLERAEPLPAVLLDARWDLLMANVAYVRLERALAGKSSFPGGPLQFTKEPRPNRVRALLNPRATTIVLNRREVMGALLQQIELDACSSADPSFRAWLGRARAASEPSEVCSAGFERRPSFPPRVDLRAGRRALHLYRLVTCWSTELPSLRVEVLHPVDARSAQLLRRLVNEAR